VSTINWSGPTVAIINASTVLTDAQIKPVVQALQVAVSRDIGPIWNVGATLVQIPKGGKPPVGAWWMVLMDTSDVQGALGYHYDLTPEDLPIGKVFVKTCLDDGEPWETCLGHELYEALVDPYINAVFQVNNLLYAAEVADAVEAQVYTINNVPMTNFVTPYWFQPDATGKQYDFLDNLSKPLELAPGGYISVLDLNNPASGWTMVTADKNPKTIASSRPRAGSRRDRRRTPRSLWIRA
jgi:hypothetical protein